MARHSPSKKPAAADVAAPRAATHATHGEHASHSAAAAANDNCDAAAPVNEGRGHVGTMSPEQRTAEERRLHGVLNNEQDTNYRPRVAVPMGRDPHADVSMLEDDSPLPAASRVGRIAVEHPRKRMARALLDHLGDRRPSALDADELRALAETVGMQVDGSGHNGAVLKTDFVQAMDDLTAGFRTA